jgi:hypothetical protein
MNVDVFILERGVFIYLGRGWGGGYPWANRTAMFDVMRCKDTFSHNAFL